jgi:pyridoxal phosphate enzyme (YggS family)
MQNRAAIDREEIAKRLREVRARIANAARRSSRLPDAIRLILASKTQPLEAIRAAYDAGARDFGENYVQEAVSKRAHLKDLVDAKWHLIGHLQTNKIKLAANTFDTIQTLDSVRLADALAGIRVSLPLRVLIEVNLAAEASKSGVAPGQAQSLIESARDKFELAGLMTIAPQSESVADARGYFAELRELRDRLAASTGLALSELSMGMTGDFEVAIEEGATMVRIGRAVFGERRK